MPKTLTATSEKLPHLKTPLPGPEARRIVEADARYISPSYTRSYPLAIRRGSGAMVEDVDGNRFLDFSAGIAVVATGHSHPEVVAAIQRQAADFIHMSGTDFYYENMVELARKLEAIAPGLPAGQAGAGPKRTFFTNSGTEAIEAALKLARWATGRTHFIAFYGCFHGRTYGSLSLTSSKAVQRERMGPFLPGVVHAPYAYPYRCPMNAPAERCAEACLNYLENTILKTVVSPKDVAAIVVEPMQGEGGYVVPPNEFLQGLQRLCRQHGMLLVADEVQSGMGRTGKWWASEHAGITPDIVCVAKGIASGMPLGAIIASADLMTWPPGAHASTFGGNPVCVAAALATMRLLEDGLIANAKRMGDYIFGRLADWPQRHRLVGEVRGRGLMIGLELVRDKQTKERAHEERDAVVQAAFERGLLILGCGNNTLRLMPPLVIDQEQADCALQLLDEALTEVEKNA